MTRTRLGTLCAAVALLSIGCDKSNDTTTTLDGGGGDAAVAVLDGSHADAVVASEDGSVSTADGAVQPVDGTVPPDATPPSPMAPYAGYWHVMSMTTPDGETTLVADGDPVRVIGAVTISETDDTSGLFGARLGVVSDNVLTAAPNGTPEDFAIELIDDGARFLLNEDTVYDITLDGDSLTFTYNADHELNTTEGTNTPRELVMMREAAPPTTIDGLWQLTEMTVGEWTVEAGACTPGKGYLRFTQDVVFGPLLNFTVAQASSIYNDDACTELYRADESSFVGLSVPTETSIEIYMYDAEGDNDGYGAYTYEVGDDGVLAMTRTSCAPEVSCDAFMPTTMSFRRPPP